MCLAIPPHVDSAVEDGDRKQKRGKGQEDSVLDTRRQASPQIQITRWTLHGQKRLPNAGVSGGGYKSDRDGRTGTRGYIKNEGSTYPSLSITKAVDAHDVGG